MEKDSIYYATGKRKTAVAKTWMKPGTGNIVINNKALETFFPTESAKFTLMEPLIMTNNSESFDIKVTVRGGGISGQVGAIRHGITRALIQFNPDLRSELKKAGFVKRDPRTKERKKYGQRGARARFQFSKR